MVDDHRPNPGAAMREEQGAMGDVAEVKFPVPERFRRGRQRSRPPSTSCQSSVP